MQLSNAAAIAVAAGLVLIHVARSSRAEVQLLVFANEYLESAFFSLGSCPISLLDLCGSILVCMRYRSAAFEESRSRSWLEMLLSCCLMQFGGTTLTGLVLGQTPSWIVSHAAFPALLLAFYLTFYCPMDAYWRVLHSSPCRNLLLPVIKVLSSISSAHAVTSWGQDKALYNTFHVNAERIALSIFTCVFCGTLSGCGGGILTDCLSLLRHPSYTWSPPMFLQSSAEGFAAAHVLTKCFFLSATYYVLLHPLQLPLSAAMLALGVPETSSLYVAQVSTGTYTRAQAHLAITFLSLLSLATHTFCLHDPSYAYLSALLRAALGVGDSWKPPAEADNNTTGDTKAPASTLAAAASRTSSPPRPSTGAGSGSSDADAPWLRRRSRQACR